MVSPRKYFVIFLAMVLAVTGSVTFASKKKKDKKTEAVSELDAQQRALHALNRLTFGPRPGDVERVMAVGVDKWIDEQLHPEKINDSALDARLAPLRTLKMDTRAMLENFPPPQVVKAVAEGRMALPSDPAKRAVYEAQLDRYRDRQEKKQEQGGQNQAGQNQGAQAGDDSTMTDAQKQERREQRERAETQAENLMQMPPDQRYAQLLRIGDEQRRDLVALPPATRERLIGDLTPQQRETVMALVNPQLVVISELQQGKLLRAIYSERQLDEVMTDFWFNHFNVFVPKGADRYMVTSYERDVIRPHALGKFKDLLMATAKSPAMLFYLDNWQSVGPNSEFARGVPKRGRNGGRPRMGVGGGVRCGPFGCFPRAGVGTRVPIGGGPRPQRNPQAQQRAAKAKGSGLNENYARELMELHTLGVDGGYTQKDVTEVARVFTGWTLKEPRKGGEFDFNERRHEPGPKHVLGKEIKQHGEDEGVQVLEMLARHPSTAHFISTKLAQRFVSDTPPLALVDRMSKTFLESDGDIREVLRTMFRSPEFWTTQTYRAKVKTPLEFVASAVRASGADVQNPMALVQTLNRMGMPLYGAQPPTGYSMKAETWVNSAALLERMNFAVALAAGRTPGVTVDQQQMLTAYNLGKHDKLEPRGVITDDKQALLAQLENALLAGDVSRQTHETIRKQLDDPQKTPNVGVIAGLILGSPEFQRR